MKRLLFFGVLAFTTLPSIKGQNLDIDILREINTHRNASLDPSFMIITNSVTPLSIAMPVAFLANAILKKDSSGKAKALIVCSTVIVASIISTTLKQTVQRERPFTTYPDIQKVASGGSYSFPSGHTSSAFALATSFSIVNPKWYVIVPSYLWAATVGYSRMDLGVHYPSDVLAGAIVGSGSAFLSYKINQWMHKTPHRSVFNNQR